MKKLIIGAALVATLASPAFAASYDSNFGSGNTVPAPGATYVATDAYAYAPRHVNAQSALPNDRDTVYFEGQYVGRDPDANVRLELLRSNPLQ